MPRVSIIIPVYNGENFLARTIQSLQNQDFKDFEVLLVDDQSLDTSFQIIQSISSQDPRFRCLQTPENLGIVSKVMNFAKLSILGEYFIYSSQDDFFSTDWLGKLVARAELTNADAVLPDVVFFSKSEAESRRIVGIDGDRGVIIDGRTAFYLSLDWKISTNALWRSRLIKEIGYFDFGMYADEYTARVFFLNCAVVSFCDGVFYYFQGNPNAITKAISPKLLDRPYNDYRIYSLVYENNFELEIVSQCCRAAAFCLIECAADTFRYPQLRAYRENLSSAIESMSSPVFLASLRAALIGSGWRRLLIPLVIRKKLLLYSYSAVRVFVGKLRTLLKKGSSRLLK